MVLERDPDSKLWVTYVPSLEFLSTFGSTREESLEKTHEAILGYLEAAAKKGIPVPVGHPDAEVVSLEISVA